MSLDEITNSDYSKSLGTLQQAPGAKKNSVIVDSTPVSRVGDQSNTFTRQNSFGSQSEAANLNPYPQNTASGLVPEAQFTKDGATFGPAVSVEDAVKKNRDAQFDRTPFPMQGAADPASEPEKQVGATHSPSRSSSVVYSQIKVESEGHIKGMPTHSPESSPPSDSQQSVQLPTERVSGSASPAISHISTQSPEAVSERSGSLQLDSLPVARAAHDQFQGKAPAQEFAQRQETAHSYEPTLTSKLDRLEASTAQARSTAVRSAAEPVEVQAFQSTGAAEVAAAAKSAVPAYSAPIPAESLTRSTEHSVEITYADSKVPNQELAANYSHAVANYTSADKAGAPANRSTESTQAVQPAHRPADQQESFKQLDQKLFPSHNNPLDSAPTQSGARNNPADTRNQPNRITDQGGSSILINDGKSTSRPDSSNGTKSSTNQTDGAIRGGNGSTRTNGSDNGLSTVDTRKQSNQPTQPNRITDQGGSSMVINDGKSVSRTPDTSSGTKPSIDRTPETAGGTKPPINRTSETGSGTKSSLSPAESVRGGNGSTRTNSSDNSVSAVDTRRQPDQSTQPNRVTGQGGSSMVINDGKSINRTPDTAGGTKPSIDRTPETASGTKPSINRTPETAVGTKSPLNPTDSVRGDNGGTRVGGFDTGFSTVDTRKQSNQPTQPNRITDQGGSSMAINDGKSSISRTPDAAGGTKSSTNLTDGAIRGVNGSTRTNGSDNGLSTVDTRKQSSQPNRIIDQGGSSMVINDGKPISRTPDTASGTKPSIDRTPETADGTKPPINRTLETGIGTKSSTNPTDGAIRGGNGSTRVNGFDNTFSTVDTRKQSNQPTQPNRITDQGGSSMLINDGKSIFRTTDSTAGSKSSANRSSEVSTGTKPFINRTPETTISTKSTVNPTDGAIRSAISNTRAISSDNTISTVDTRKQSNQPVQPTRIADQGGSSILIADKKSINRTLETANSSKANNLAERVTDSKANTTIKSSNDRTGVRANVSDRPSGGSNYCPTDMDNRSPQGFAIKPFIRAIFEGTKDGSTTKSTDTSVRPSAKLSVSPTLTESRTGDKLTATAGKLASDGAARATGDAALEPGAMRNRAAQSAEVARVQMNSALKQAIESKHMFADDIKSQPGRVIDLFSKNERALPDRGKDAASQAKDRKPELPLPISTTHKEKSDKTKVLFLNPKRLVNPFGEVDKPVLEQPMTIAQALNLDFSPSGDFEKESDEEDDEQVVSYIKTGVLGGASASTQQPQPQQSNNSDPEHEQYVVQDGESLGSIAATVLGDEDLIDLLFELNREVLAAKHPWPLRRGIKLLLPTAQEITAFRALNANQFEMAALDTRTIARRYDFCS